MSKKNRNRNNIKPEKPEKQHLHAIYFQRLQEAVMGGDLNMETFREIVRLNLHKETV